MSGECDQKEISPLPFFESCQFNIAENSSNIQTEEEVVTIKREPIHNLDNTRNSIQSKFELLPPSELKTEPNDASSGIDLEVEVKTEVEATGYNNLPEASLGTEIDRESNQKKIPWKIPETKPLDTSKSQLFHCEYCDYAAKQNSHLKRHIKEIHLKIKPYKCDICSFQCAQKLNLKRHMSSHIKKCRYCDYIGINTEALSTHIKANHDHFKCRFCHYVAKGKPRLKAHENGIHLKKEKYPCPDCSYTSLYRSNMRNHRIRNHEEIYYNCDKCDYKTKTQIYLKNHINTIHTRSKLVYCAHCDYKSTRKTNLTIHLRNNHALFEAFKCEKCDFACKERSQLIKHLKIEHDKNYNFECNNCGFLAKTKFRLKAHISAKHLKERPFWCKFCPYGGLTKTRIVNHAKAKHKDAFMNSKSIKDEFILRKKTR